MLTGIHILLTYKCTLECEHCFVHASPSSPGVITLQQIKDLIREARKLEHIEWIFFEGGEPFLFYPILLEAIQFAKENTFKVGLVTNAYGAITDDDALVWFRPLAELGVDYINISDDQFHYEEEHSPAKLGVATARKLGIPIDPICIKKPFVEALPGEGLHKGEPVIGGGAMFRGRAADKLIEGLPRKPGKDLVKCPYEDLVTPERLHVDPYGHVHLCQGVSMGNAFAHPLSTLVSRYDASAHPIVGPLVQGGPAELARRYEVSLDGGYVDECHCCYLVRRALLDRFPEHLAPRQVYGL
ncbi:MAG: radical SAM protein [Desulfovibrio sp.]|nr:radical SAM protein [Desulfovibrio sp.]